MAESTPGKETKIIMPPAAFVAWFRATNGGKFLDDLPDLPGLAQMEFSTDKEAGKAEKQAAGEAGNIIVMNGVVTLQGELGGKCKILLAYRDAADHTITTDHSIMTSGDPRKTPREALLKKVAFDPAPADADFARLGYVMSKPEQTGPIPYLFNVFSTRVAAATTITKLGKDEVRWADFAEAADRVKGKPVELAIVERLMKA